MTELQKRIIKSFFLLGILYLSFVNNIILSITLLLITFIILDELNKIFSKIFLKKKLINFIAILIAVIYTTYFSLCIWFFLTLGVSDNKILFLYILTVCISTDIGGYTFGRILKGKKITSISPNKTYSGMFGSFLLSVFVTIVFFNELKVFTNILVLTIFLSFVSQVGDLIISYLKRKAKIKDTGKLLPGHGGLLDRLDGIYFVIPLGILFVSF